MDIGSLVLPLILVILGMATGGLSNVTSGGAGIFTIYYLTNYLNLPIQESTGTVLAASTLIVLIGAISFYRRGQVDVQLAITVGLSGVVGAFLAARWASTIDSIFLEQLFGVFTLGLAVFTAFRFLLDWRRSSAASTPVSVSPASATPVQSAPTAPTRSRLAGTDPTALAVQIAKGALIGVATGLFGVGLASLSIVLMLYLFKLEMRTILGTSLFASFFRYLGGSIGYLTVGEIDPVFFVLLVIGGGAGSILGARLVLGGKKGSRDVYIKVIVIGILLFISYEFLLKGLI